MGRHDINIARLEPHAGGDHLDWKMRGTAKQLGELALVIRVQMLDQDKRHGCIAGEIV